MNSKKAYELVDNLPWDSDDKAIVRDIIEALTGEKAPRRKLEIPRQDLDKEYYFIAKDGSAESVAEDNDEFDDRHFSTCNYFLNKSDAETHSRRLRTFNRLWAFARQVETAEVGEDSYTIVSTDKREVFPTITYTRMGETLLPRFRTRKDAQLVLDSLDEDDLAVLRGEV